MTPLGGLWCPNGSLFSENKLQIDVTVEKYVRSQLIGLGFCTVNETSAPLVPKLTLLGRTQNLGHAPPQLVVAPF